MKLIKYNNNDIDVDITFSKEENTVWMSQKEIGLLYGVDQKLVSKLIKKVVSNYGDLTSIFAKMEKNGSDGKSRRMNHYNLDIIRRVGYKIDPLFASEFISWVKGELGKLNTGMIPTESNYIRYDNGEVTLDVSVDPKEETVYLSQDQLAILFDTTKQNISNHINNIYDCKELDERATVKDFLTVQIESGREVNRAILLYNLDMIISLGYRINNKRGIEFRRWATKVLKTRKKENK